MKKNGLKVAAAAVAMSSVLVMLAGRDVQPPEAVPDAIAARWLPEQPPAPKTDRLPLPAAEPALPEVIEPLSPEVQVTTVAAIKRAHAEQRPRERNVCTRHGMHKVETHGGRSWRCKP